MLRLTRMRRRGTNLACWRGGCLRRSVQPMSVMLVARRMGGARLREVTQTVEGVKHYPAYG